MRAAAPSAQHPLPPVLEGGSKHRGMSDACSQIAGSRCVKSVGVKSVRELLARGPTQRLDCNTPCLCTWLLPLHACLLPCSAQPTRTIHTSHPPTPHQMHAPITVWHSHVSSSQKTMPPFSLPTQSILSTLHSHTQVRTCSGVMSRVTKLDRDWAKTTRARSRTRSRSSSCPQFRAKWCFDLGNASFTFFPSRTRKSGSELVRASGTRGAPETRVE